MSLATDLIASLVADTGPLVRLRERAAARPRRVVFAEGEDQRVVAAACALRELALAHPVLIGDPAAVRAAISAQGADPGSIRIVDAQGAERGAVAAFLLERRLHKDLQPVAAKELASRPVWLGAGLVGLGHFEAMVAGAALPTAEVVRAGLWCVGPADGIQTVSASFLMVPPEGGRALLFADSAIVVAPDADQLVEIGLASAATWRALFGAEPRVAVLSFSTMASADHALARGSAAVAARLRDAGLHADGELQVDAALDPGVARAKAPASPVAGRADVLLFPDLQSGNIGYKLVQRLAGWRAIGPLVQGLARPVFDLSRGCTASEIVDTAVIAALAAGDGNPEGRR